MKNIDFDNIPEGLEIRYGRAIRISFMYKGIRCREQLNLEPTKPNFRHCANLRGEILNKIARNEFSYADYFPNSKLAKRLGFIREVEAHNCGDLLRKQLHMYTLMVDNGYMSPSTYAGYKKVIIGKLIPSFYKYNVTDITPLLIKNWLLSLSGSTARTIGNYLIPLRSMLDEAVDNELIVQNPIRQIALNRIISTVAKRSEFEADPFTEDEQAIVLNAASGQIRNLIQFGFWSGLRTSELIALKWADIDFNDRTVNITRAKVCNVLKSPKTRSGVRTVVLLPKAYEALKAQLEYTSHDEYVFHNPNTDKPWASSNKVSDMWRNLLSKLDIRYRNCYQMRHTYTSTLLSNGENPLWVSTQTGHVNVNMIFKHYGKWLPKKNNYVLVGMY